MSRRFGRQPAGLGSRDVKRKANDEPSRMACLLARSSWKDRTWSCLRTVCKSESKWLDMLFEFNIHGSVRRKEYSIIYPTRCNVTQFILSGNCSTCFGWYHHPSLGAQTSGICKTVTATCRYNLQALPRTQHGYHHDTKVKPETATAVIELLMMGGRTPETCWAVNERQDNKLENYVWLVIYLNCTMMQGLTDLNP